MNEVVDCAAGDRAAWQREEHVISRLERPRAGEVGISRASEGRAGIAHVVVELREKAVRRLIGVPGTRGHVDVRPLHDPGDPPWHGGDELCEMRKRKGLRVRLPLTLFGGNTLK